MPPAAPALSPARAAQALNVLMVTETWPPEINGVALTVAALARGLASEGHRVRVVRPAQPAGSEPEPLPGVRELPVPGARLPRCALVSRHSGACGPSSPASARMLSMWLPKGR